MSATINKIFDFFLIRKQGKLQKRGKINLIGRLQLTTEKTREEDNEGIVQLRILRTQVMISFLLLILEDVYMYSVSDPEHKVSVFFRPSIIGHS